MQERKRFPIGVQDFASLREGGFAYVDKTEYIYNLVHSSKQYFLSRPRRFGSRRRRTSGRNRASAASRRPAAPGQP